jgi:hypothetical protein
MFFLTLPVPIQGLSMKSKTPYTLSILIAVFATIASAGGLLLPGLYRDNMFVTSAWMGNDVITLFLAVPILVMAMVYALSFLFMDGVILFSTIKLLDSKLVNRRRYIRWIYLSASLAILIVIVIRFLR